MHLLTELEITNSFTLTQLLLQQQTTLILHHQMQVVLLVTASIHGLFIAYRVVSTRFQQSIMRLIGTTLTIFMSLQITLQKPTQSDILSINQTSFLMFQQIIQYIKM